MNEADVTKTHAAKIDALNRLAASLIRSGAPTDAVQKFVDAELDRIEFIQGKQSASATTSLAAIERCETRARIARGDLDRSILVPGNPSSERT